MPVSPGDARPHNVLYCTAKLTAEDASVRLLEELARTRRSFGVHIDAFAFRLVFSRFSATFMISNIHQAALGQGSGFPCLRRGFQYSAVKLGQLPHA